jgi:hypothetical protein
VSGDDFVGKLGEPLPEGRPAKLGEKNWWIPRWLDRVLPNLVVEPEDVEPLEGEPELAGSSV